MPIQKIVNKYYYIKIQMQIRRTHNSNFNIRLKFSPCLITWRTFILVQQLNNSQRISVQNGSSNPFGHRPVFGSKRPISWSFVCLKPDQWYSLFPISLLRLPNTLHQWYTPQLRGQEREKERSREREQPRGLRTTAQYYSSEDSVKHSWGKERAGRGVVIYSIQATAFIPDRS